MGWTIKFDDKEYFEKQRKKLNLREQKKLIECIDKLIEYGPLVRYARNHEVKCESEVYRTMDISGSKRLAFQYNGNILTIILVDCDNHKIKGIRYGTRKFSMHELN